MIPDNTISLLANATSRYRVSDARRVARERYGINYLLSVDSDPKTTKSNALGEYLTAIMYLSPGGELCPSATPGCLAACLHTAGNPVFWRGKSLARQNRTTMYRQDRYWFLQLLTEEIWFFRNRCRIDNVKPAIRLNGTSDIIWERVYPELFELFSDVVFYDYTKHAKRMSTARKLPPNYDLTFSRSEVNESDCLSILNGGGRVAVVFSPARTKPLPDSWHGHPVIDADKHDLRFAEPRGVVCGLRAKGRARSDVSGFVVQC